MGSNYFQRLADAFSEAQKNADKNVQQEILRKSGGIESESYKSLYKPGYVREQMEKSKQRSAQAKANEEAKKREQAAAATAAAQEAAEKARQDADAKRKLADAYKNTTTYQEDEKARGAALGAKVNAGPSSEIARNAGAYRAAVENDPTQRQLEREADRADREAQAASDNAVYAQDMDIINQLTPEQRKNLEAYSNASTASRWSRYTPQGDILPNTNDRAFLDAEAALVGQNVGGTVIDQKRLKELTETFQRSQNAESIAGIKEDAAATVNNGFGSAVGANLATIPGNMVGGTLGTMGYLDEMANRTGRYSTMDPNNIGQFASNWSDAVREQTSKNIVGDGKSLIRQGLNVGYQAVMSSADSIARAYLAGGPGGAALCATKTFADTMQSASEQGATPTEAAALATVNSFIEYATEKIPLDELINTAKGGGNLSRLINALRQAGIEASTEELSLVGTTLAEAAILRDKSDYNLTVDELIQGGATEEEARAVANKKLMNDALTTLMVSGLSGGISSAIFSSPAGSGSASENQEAQGKIDVDESQNGKYNAGGNEAQSDVQADTQSDAQMVMQGLEETAATLPQPQEAPKTAEQIKADEIAKTALLLYQDKEDMYQEKAAASEKVYQSEAIPQRTQDAQQAAPAGIIGEAVEKLKTNGTVSNKQAEAILQDTEAVRELVRQGLMEDPSSGMTKSEQRNAVKDAIRQMAGDGVPAELSEEGTRSALEDLGQDLLESNQQAQNQTELTGGNENGERLQGADGTGLPGGDGAGRVSGTNDGTLQVHGQTPGGMEQGSQVVPGSIQGESGGSGSKDDLRVSDFVRVSDSLQQAQQKRGTQTYPVADTTADPVRYEQALKAGRESDTENGWCVTPKSAQELREHNVRTFMDENGTVGVGIAPDGDIVAVFKNKNGGPRKALDTMLPIAIEQGGDRLDCYGEGLARLYSKYGFVPVARVEFNPKYANPGWTPDKGTPYIYVMMHNGDSADTVAQKMGSYPKYTDEQLNALPTYGKDDYDAAIADRDSQMKSKAQETTGQGTTEQAQAAVTPQAQGSPQQVDTQIPSAQSGQAANSDSSTLGMQNPLSGDLGKSKTVTNTGLRSADADIREGYKATLDSDPSAPYYDIKHNADTKRTAKERTATPEQVRAEYDYLLGKNDWTAEDLQTAKLITKDLMQSGGEGAEKQVTEMNLKIRDIGRNAGQVTQAFAIIGTMDDAADPMTAAQYATNALYDMKMEDTIFKPQMEQGDPAAQSQVQSQAQSQKSYQDWQKSTAESITKIGIEIAKVKDGDSAAMRDIIRQIANRRGTTAWFGTKQRLSKPAEKVMSTMGFEDLRAVASAQLASMPDDYRARSKMEIAQSVRKQSMLTSLKTFARNIYGNAFAGLLDSASDSTGGRMLDTLMSKVTGQRTIGNDFKAGAYAKGAKDAARFASLCVELNIPIETDGMSAVTAAMGKGSGGKYVGKTFRSNGNLAMRVMYAYQKYMSYALEVSDKIFEGGTNAAVSESLRGLENSHLTAEQVDQLSEFVANDRTFKDATWTDDSGEHGAVLSKKATQVKNVMGPAGDIVMPFAKVPMNVAQKGIDYTAGIAKGAAEIASILSDAKAGKPIDPARQRKAASDFGKGVTGVGLIAMFASAAAMGAVKVNEPEDKDEKALAQAEGRSGAQINWSALNRGLGGGSEKWQDGDTISSLDFLEPFNTQLYLGYELAQENSALDALKAYPGATIKSVFNAFMDSPMMTGLNDLLDMFGDIAGEKTDAERLDAVAGYAGETVSSFVPQIVRQAAQATDGYYRDTRGDTALETAMNSLFAAIPGLSQTLPMKYSGLGEAQKRGGFAETFLDPTATKTYHPNEVTGYLETLSDSLGGDTSFIPDRQAPMKITVDGETVGLTGEQRELYQKTYGEQVNAAYSALMDSPSFQKLPDETKAAILKSAEQSATDWAKAAVGHGEQPEQGGAEISSSLITSQVDKEFDRAFSKKDAAAADQAYALYQGLTPAERTAIKEKAEGQTRLILDAKENGVDIDTQTLIDMYGQYRDINNREGAAAKVNAQEWSYAVDQAYNSGKIDSEQKEWIRDNMEVSTRITIDTPKYDEMVSAGMDEALADAVQQTINAMVDPSDRDKWNAIASSSNLSEADMDIAMKAYMTDYDPSKEDPVTTELKYDYARQELGLTPQQWVKAYDVQREDGKKAEKIAKWKAQGFTDAEANTLYRLLAANGKTKIDVVAWSGQGKGTSAGADWDALVAAYAAAMMGQ